jgi:primosomal protein N' (replication factor Y) (superfamily II helicase)
LNYFEVAVDAPLFTPLTYGQNEAPLNLQRGVSVIVPLGKRQVSAVVLNTNAKAGEHKIKPVASLDETKPTLPDRFLAWLEWLADYYVYPIGQVTALAFPPLKKSEKQRASKKAPVVKSVEMTVKHPLTQEQIAAVAQMPLDQKFQVHLLHGVTGSGKTEVYLELLEETIANGKKGLVLVPEISLTPQLVHRFAARFGEKIAVIHSHLTEREKTNQWWSFVDGEKPILIGARSALFCPASDIGVIIVDEEHEPSYKQEEKLKYHARDAAIMLAKFSNCPIVLGSATPSLETWHNAQSGKYKLHQMKSRVMERKLPTAEVVDLREEKAQRKEQKSLPETQKQVAARELKPFWLSEKLWQEMCATLDKGQQVALFLNRRGMAQSVFCLACGFSHRCPNCEITLTLHGKSHLVCHYCDYSEKLGDECPHCHSPEIRALGLGTEQVEEDVKKLFPACVVARADRDEINSRESLEDLIARMESGEINVLIGTQMIAKGLDFKKLTLVGLVLADVGFNLPDFRSTERSFQLLTQVSGRSGRHIESGGTVVIQTYNPDYPALSFSKTSDFEGFAKAELALREELKYPPFGRVASIRIQGPDLDKVVEAARIAASRARKLVELNDAYKFVQVLGPSPAPMAKIRNQYRYHLLLKSPPQPILSAFCRQILSDEKWAPTGTKVQVDIDPMNLL